MADPQKVVINEKFITDVRGKLHGYAVSLATTRTTTPLLNALKVEAGAEGYQAGTSLESAVKNAGTKLDERLGKLKDDLDLQVRNLDRLLLDTEDVEALNTEKPSMITNYLDPAFLHPSSTKL